VIIIQALLLARSRYVVGMLLTTWLESLEHRGNARTLPWRARVLPIGGTGDLADRLQLVREAIPERQGHAADLRTLAEAAATFSIACEQLRKLAPGGAQRARGASAVAGRVGTQ
jgi:hypothetical protein